jgi:catechol 2,3-dioxygenase-like lactoylglutathione lyase family enzyme
MLHVDDIKSAMQFYGGLLGFEEQWRYQPDPSQSNPSYVGIKLGDIFLHVSSFSGDGKNGGVAVLFMDDVNQYCKQLSSSGVDIGDGPVDQSWGNRECYIEDPFGNQLRLTQVGAFKS